MKHARAINRVAAAISGLAIAATLLGRAGIAIALLSLSSLLLVRNTEALRAYLTRETRP